MHIDDSVEVLKGVGAKSKSLLKRLGIETVGDLIHHFPRKYDDYSNITEIGSLSPGNITISAEVISVNGRYVRRGLHITEAIFQDATGGVKAVWFNQPYRVRQLTKKTPFFVSGSYEFSNRRYQIMNPSVEKVADFTSNTARILPIYKETKGLKSHSFRKLFSGIDFENLQGVEEYDFLEQDITKKQALKMLHLPSSMEDTKIGEDYFEFLRLFEIIMASQLIRMKNESYQGPRIPFNVDVVRDFVEQLPFKLTNAQRRATWAVITDMEKEKPMNRLVEGDVGSGKTVVAILAALSVVRSGFQAAIMAPTEVLARQHYANLVSMLPDDVRVELLVGSSKATHKKQVKEELLLGSLQVVVGTHSLVQPDVTFRNLGLVVIDEQHRFGVKQRAALSKATSHFPHLLSMTATPIPRTLALTVFGDLDISVIEEMPPGRLPVETKVIPPNSRKQVYKKLHEYVASGNQGFIIYPLVDESIEIDAKSAVVEFEKLQRGEFRDMRLRLLHGRLKPDEKVKVMEEFSKGGVDILVSTTVVEVGVDVPNASFMVVEGAERFGLAQIHQLRGRIGRGGQQAYCYLIPSSSQVPKRLRALESIQDGFKLAEYDLEIRGPGAIYGTLQHGALSREITKLSDVGAIEKAREIAIDLIKNQEKLLQYPHLKNMINKYSTITRLN